jgi:hypothetical protein
MESEIFLPPTLSFNLQDPRSFKQVVTISNLEQHPLTFKLLTTNPACFSMSDCNGTIQPQTQKDL